MKIGLFLLRTENFSSATRSQRSELHLRLLSDRKERGKQ